MSRHKQVLLLDDDPTVHEDVGNILAGEYDVDSALTPEDFWKKVHEKRYDRIVVDWLLDNNQLTAKSLLEDFRQKLPHFSASHLVVLTHGDDADSPRWITREGFLYVNKRLQTRLKEYISDPESALRRAYEDHLVHFVPEEQRADQEERQADQLHKFAHRTLGLLGAFKEQIRVDGSLQQMSVMARALYEFLSLTFARYREDRHDPSREFNFSRPDEDPATLYARIAAAIALMRASQPKSKDYETTRKTLEFATSTLAQADSPGAPAPPDLLLMEAGYSEVRCSYDKDEAVIVQRKVRKEAFAVMFVHCMKQALYHGLRCRCDEPHAFTEGVSVELSIRNGFLNTEFRNPGVPPGRREIVRDAADLADLGEHFLGASSNVAGPAWSDATLSWHTSFRMRVPVGTPNRMDTPESGK